MDRPPRTVKGTGGDDQASRRCAGPPLCGLCGEAVACGMAMIIPVHGRAVLSLLRVILNPRLMMVYALVGGGVIRSFRQRRWRNERRKWRENTWEARERRKEQNDGE